ncbi:sensor histidine kinase [Paludibacterium purpuratum]|uniref:C4-dicarboxylate transport sensor protein DctB n=1 Tax=Paludibacterium purpuratum TaxID=1144873 RepID=A0A4R7B9F1_9NEIS|nr:ATP-binding protein [Paludibacterium purpuratum]TDR80217.1 two-component system C4-dicarboxylate transport sensor histidine kinase DctB [Paludibacterium purpuratum]
MRFPAYRPAKLAYLLSFLGLVIACAAITDKLVLKREVETLRNDGDQRLAQYSSTLARDIGQYAVLPKTVSLDPRIAALLTDPNNRARLRQVDDYLQTLNDQVGTLDIYLIAHDGHVLASSNWNQPDSFIGRDLSYRLYFREAQPGKVAEFYGIGTTHNTPGYYLSSAVSVAGQPLGVVAVKVSLDQLEKSWLQAESPALLSDENGVIVLSSVTGWKYSTLRPLSPTLQRQLDDTQQYNRRRLQPLGLITRQTLDDNTHIVELRNIQTQPPAFATTGLFLTKTHAIKGTPWQLTVFYDLAISRNLAHTSAALAAAGVALLLAGSLLIAARRRARRTALRNVELSASNTRLQQEIRERREAERHLKAAQDELIQASKLAVIGQMAAGVAHEINQPLAALGTLSDNAREFLQRGDSQTAQFNLERISQLVLRLGNITGQLRSFAKRAGTELGAVDLAVAVEHALSLLDSRLRKTSVVLRRTAPDETLYVHGNALRLEQVLINLLGNALDACQDHPSGSIDIGWQCTGARVRLWVADNGPGLSDEALSHLFEPFFTSKPQGLGLGLAISASIVRDFGGSLTAGNRPQGGAEFELDLPVGNQHEAH